MRRDWDLILVGAGLANGLIAWHLRHTRPELAVLLIDRDRHCGGNHTWSFHASDLSAGQLRWLAPLIDHRWPGYQVRFPAFTRELPGEYCTITSASFAVHLARAMGERVLTGTAVSRITPDTVQLPDGQTLHAHAVIDGRGAQPSHHLQLGYQAFIGQELKLPEPHGLLQPVLMDATVAQGDGYRFVYTLPLSPDRLLIEDTHYIDHQHLDPAHLRQAIGQYAAEQGWGDGELLREESGSLPIILDGDFEAFWGQAKGMPCSGLRAGLFHPTTGYSLPCAVRTAELIAAAPSLDHAHLFNSLRESARVQWRRQRFFRLLNRMLFMAGNPSDRWRVMQRFYGLGDGLIERFYAGRITWADKARLLSGKPPVPVGAALRAMAFPDFPSRELP